MEQVESYYLLTVILAFVVGIQVGVVGMQILYYFLHKNDK